MAFSEERYSRQILFSGIGSEGQQRLQTARVVIIGCGATGSTLISLLARAGVGTLSIVDRDYIEPSNLQRQSLFDEADATEFLPKAVAAARKVAALNSNLTVEPHVADLTPANIEQLLDGFPLILDGTDNFETRYLINDYAVKNHVPWIYAGAVGSVGVTMNVLPGETACLACLFPEPPQGTMETCETSGILNAAVSAVASLAATEALKLLVGAKDRLRGTLLSQDVWWNDHAEIAVGGPRPECRCCGRNDFTHLTGETRPPITLCGRNSVQIHERQRTINFTQLQAQLAPHGQVRYNSFALKFVREPHEITLFPDGRAIIKGTSDPVVARSLYTRFIGN